MTRTRLLQQLEEEKCWDLLVIGGGATGLGVAVEGASRGYRTLLLERDDFGSGTSSRSTKLIHGGVRYLQQGNLSLVLEALHERGILIRNAPHLVHNLSFVVPLYDWWEGPFYGIGLKLYDMLAGKLGLGPSQILSREETLRRIPTVEPAGLRGGVIYHDGQFDDARLAVALARTCADLGGVPLNRMEVAGFLKGEGLVRGVAARDRESGREYEIEARVVVNAAGPSCDAIRQLDDPGAQPVISPSQGVHLVLPRESLPGDSAIMVPHTDDGRVLFAVPWHERVIVGTTDTPVDRVTAEPRPLAAEVEFLLEHAARYLSRDPGKADILSVFAGLRPLVRGEAVNTAALSRDHTIMVSTAGLVTITGGKWTTYRRMAEDTVNSAVRLAGLEERPSRTADLPIHGWLAKGGVDGEWAMYGAEAAALEELCAVQPALRRQLHPRLPYRLAEVVWGVRYEWARSVEDVLSRRTRALILDARASMEAAPEVAALMATELGRDEVWQAAEVAAFRTLAEGYLP
ncbi:glycerol-3-phosphate dehydrogenase/oxidase [Geobacter grbiciae]|uniref:glycerol-3-phosphate dehydrogenase/oxidase n=1 Tax=Geobacter grbiciae TaxID=155042 RepID=UPI001C00C8E8|nr:glycerol-3-phosphate dehydrogenase/oxidase [Geobacter grbiciae]MBT1074307.1 glycerol-3-phosphate dehydrogenase/oxidase [Geobacter grbiciae]